MLQGERRDGERDNRDDRHASILVRDSACRRAASPQIEVTFDIDANGIVNVSAKDLGTGKEQKITITASSGLSKEDVDRMMREAEANAEQDKRAKESVEKRNLADQAVYAAERLLQDSGDKLGAESKQAVQGAVEEVKSALEGEDVAAIDSAIERLNTAQQTAAQELYKNTQAADSPPPGGADAGGPAPDSAADGGEVIDAEVVEDDKK